MKLKSYKTKEREINLKIKQLKNKRLKMLSLDIQKKSKSFEKFSKKAHKSLKDARDEVIHNGTLEVVIKNKPKKIYL